MRSCSINHGRHLDHHLQGKLCMLYRFFNLFPAAGVWAPPYTEVLDRLVNWKTSHCRWRVLPISSGDHYTTLLNTELQAISFSKRDMNCSVASSGLVEVVQTSCACAKVPKKSPWILRPSSLELRSTNSGSMTMLNREGDMTDHCWIHDRWFPTHLSV